MAGTTALGLDAETERALTDFVMNCPELTTLESLLSRFNIFRVLRAARHEIRHSNMLAWFLNPDETHGLGARFLRRWLMRIVHDADQDIVVRLHLPSPIEIDALDIDSVEVARESDNIDLLLVIRTVSGAFWVICIENKVEAAQHSNQLRRYREVVERRYADAEHLFFVFLTKHDEEPEDSGFVTSSYEVIEGVLRSCLKERDDMIGSEPLFLATQYLELLAEDFMGDSRAAELARKIYRTHRKAIDFILENRNDPISEASHAMEDILTHNLSELGIVMGVQNKGYVRFVPKEWDVPQNAGGTAWGPNSRFVVCEVNFWTKKAELHITVGKAPEHWADRIWARAATAPFKQEWKKRPAQYIKPFKAKSEILVESLVDVSPEDIRGTLLDWIRAETRKKEYQEAVIVMRYLLQDLRPE
jgi:hypothetical protein